MKNNLQILLLLMTFSIFQSCKNENNGQKTIIFNEVDNDTLNENTEAQNEDIADAKEDNNFQIMGFDQMEFIENEKGYDGNGAVLKISFKMKNNTNYDITEFDLKYFVKIVYQDEEFHYFPESMGVSNENNDEKRFNGLNYYYFENNLKKSEIWKSKTERTFNLIVFKESLGIHKYSIDNEYFKRTPISADFVYKYKAISVENEFENTMYYNIIDFWKSYQQKIGLRK